MLLIPLERREKRNLEKKTIYSCLQLILFFSIFFLFFYLNVICTPPVFWVVFKLLPKAQQEFSELCAKPTVCSSFKHSLSAHLHSMTLFTFSRFKTHKIRSDTNKWPHYTRAQALTTEKPQPSDCEPIQQEKSDS